MTLSLIGKRIGNYDIQSKIGEGGMGMVYLGVHPAIGKRVAIKVLHEELSSKSDVVARFFTEARAVNDINHPNIVDIVDFGDFTFEGMVFKYIIMEFLEGESLSARIRREGVTIRETLHIVAQCASALSASHAKGVVHRDLKPENIYLLPRGPDRNYVKLLDFGIAKLTGEGGGAAMSSKTRTGMVIGTPAYMSPEQCEGRGLIDHRSDIYALGVVMYELLTGRVPFPGDGFGEVLVAHLTREPDLPSQVNPNLPPEIEAIVLHCLRKDKAQRFQSMDELLHALQDPVAHYQLWAQTAQLPPGAVPSNAFMSTVLSGPMTASQSSGLMPASVLGPPQTPWGMSGPQAYAGSSANLPMVSGQAPALTGVGMRPSAPLPNMPSEPMPVATGPRPTTLSGASGEATGPGRRPASVLLMLGGAVAIGVLAVVGVKLAKRPPKDPTPATQVDPGRKDGAKDPAAEQVTIEVKSAPPQADVLRGDVLSGPVGKTPLTIRVRKGAPLDLKLRLPGYGEETRSVPTTEDQVVDVTFSRAEVAGNDQVEEPKDRRSALREKARKERRERRKRGKQRTDGTELLAPTF